jgi:6-pyruvoyltetrahydropterin/6-carboxytetrahydropterin synthase
MPTTYLTRVEEFCSAHRLDSPHLSPEENVALFGKCNNLNGHGHNYRLLVTIRGDVDPLTGMLLELTQFSRLIRELITDAVDHKHLNLDVDFLEGVIPTAENLCAAFWKRLEHKLPAGELYEIRLDETGKNIVSLRRDA